MIEEKKWWEISIDELEDRMLTDKKRRIDPVSKMVKELFRSLDKVLSRLGVDPELETITIKEQCNALGIMLQSNNDPRTPQLHGIFVFVSKQRSVIELDQTPDIIPYAWISAPAIQKSGRAKCQIQLFQDNRLEESAEVKIV